MSESMRIAVVRSGGFAGMVREWEVALDQAPDPDRLQQLVDDCPWDDPVPDEQGADRYRYDLTAGERSTTLPETAVSGPWQALVDCVVELGTK